MGSSNPVKPRRTHVRDAPYKAFVSIYHYRTFSCSDNSKLATSRSLQRPLYKFIVDEKNDVLDVYLLLSCVLSSFDCIRFHRYHSRPPPDEWTWAAPRRREPLFHSRQPPRKSSPPRHQSAAERHRTRFLCSFTYLVTIIAKLS